MRISVISITLQKIVQSIDALPQIVRLANFHCVTMKLTTD